VDGGTAKQRRLFYTCFYRMLQSPYIFNDADGSWNDRGVILKVEHDIVFWDSMWGVFRNKQPLISLLRPELKANILRYMIHWGKHKERMPIYFFGDAAPSYFADAYLQGIDDIDIEQAYELLKKNAAEGAGTTAAREYIDEYLELGYIPHTRMAATAATLEYAHADFCLALLAKALGKDGDYRTFITRARNYRNVFDPTTGFMRGRHADGSWATPFSPTKGSNEVAYREGNAWHYTWFVPHDVHGLIELLGGREAFVTKLDECFSTPWDPADRSSWLTGFLGQYCHGNQPSHQVAYLYNYAGAPWKTQQVVRQIMDLMYGGPPKDLAFVGMDDSGEMSSWYVWSAIGLYPVCPGQRVYVIGSPLFDRITLRLPSYRERRGGDFTIEAHNKSDANRYIQSAILNGQPYDKTWLAAGDIVDGGHLILEMGPEPSSWGSSPESAPPSME
jgi:predicted alpha-1,2-mannosidase